MGHPVTKSTTDQKTKKNPKIQKQGQGFNRLKKLRCINIKIILAMPIASYFLVAIYLQQNEVRPWSFKLKNPVKSNNQSLKYQSVHRQVAKITGLKNLSLWEKLSS